MFWCRFSRFTSSWHFCTTPWPSRPCVPLHSALHAGAPEIYWIRRKTLSLFVIQLRCAVSCKWNVNGCLIPTGRLVIDARKRYISRIYRHYSCHMTTSFHLYTDSILVIWRLHSIYIPTIFFGQVKEAEQRLRHKLFPPNAWMKVADFHVLTSCPKDELHQWFIGLYGEHIIPAIVHRFTSVLQRPDLIYFDKN